MSPDKAPPEKKVTSKKFDARAAALRDNLRKRKAGQKKTTQNTSDKTNLPKEDQ